MKGLNTSTVNNKPNHLEKTLIQQKNEAEKAEKKFIGLLNTATEEEYHIMCDKLEANYYVALDKVQKLS